MEKAIDEQELAESKSHFRRQAVEWAHKEAWCDSSRTWRCAHPGKINAVIVRPNHGALIRRLEVVFNEIHIEQWLRRINGN